MRTDLASLGAGPGRGACHLLRAAGFPNPPGATAAWGGPNQRPYTCLSGRTLHLSMPSEQGSPLPRRAPPKRLALAPSMRAPAPQGVNNVCGNYN